MPREGMPVPLPPLPARAAGLPSSEANATLLPLLTRRRAGSRGAPPRDSSESSLAGGGPRLGSESSVASGSMMPWCLEMVATERLRPASSLCSSSRMRSSPPPPPPILPPPPLPLPPKLLPDLEEAFETPLELRFACEAARVQWGGGLPLAWSEFGPVQGLGQVRVQG